MIKEIPKEILIDCIMYRVTEVEGMIIFSEAQGMWGCCDRMIFSKEKYSSWQLELKTTFGGMMADHICKAFKLVQEWRGDDFGREING